MLEKLSAILKKSASTEAIAWLDETLAAQRDSFERKPFYYAFSGVSRRFEKRGGINFSEEDLKELDQEVPGQDALDVYAGVFHVADEVVAEGLAVELHPRPDQVSRFPL